MRQAVPEVSAVPCAGSGEWSAVRPRAASAMQAAAALLMLAFVVAPIQRAQAALGDATASVARDHAALRGTLVVLPMQNYDIHQMVSAAGVTVREYVTRAGSVFAITWMGTQVPDLKILLGSYFDRYVSLAMAHRSGHHVLSFDTPELSMTTVRFQRMASGAVYVPGLLPSGVSRRELR